MNKNNIFNKFIFISGENPNLRPRLTLKILNIKGSERGILSQDQDTVKIICLSDNLYKSHIFGDEKLVIQSNRRKMGN